MCTHKRIVLYALQYKEHKEVSNNKTLGLGTSLDHNQEACIGLGLSNDPVVDVPIFPIHADHVALTIVIKTRNWLFMSKSAELGTVRLLERLSFFVR
jgi:hypothetical protein